jgi:hypothetical protein|tara:strand:- start:802 stop:1092 length:291 start_codon:yes stop_codon:yes gene_type:complete
MPIIGKPLEGRQFKTDGSNSNQKPIEIEASIGDGTTGGSATPFLKLTGTAAATTDGDNNITTADVTGSGGAPGGMHKAVLVDVLGTKYWIPLYAVS